MTALACRSTPSDWSAAVLSGRRRPTGASRSARRSWLTCSTTYRDTPCADADLAEQVEVIDPRHPLYRRRFRILSVVQGQRSAGFVSVEYRLAIFSILPISATSLGGHRSRLHHRLRRQHARRGRTL